MLITLREHAIGDPGWIVSKHGEIYSSEFHFDGTFELNIADKLVRYFSEPVPFNRIWIAEVDGERAGSTALREISAQKSFVNFVILLDQFRGNGIAQQLMEKAIETSRQQGYQCVRLETFSCLVAARKLYERLGFRIAEPAKDIRQFGRPLTQEFWELLL